MIAGAVFTVGLMLIVLCGAELFTGNNLIIIPFMSKKVSAFGLAKNWTVVYIGNFVGALFLVALMAGTGLLETNSNLVGASALNIANGKVNLTFTEAFTRAILCNWLVCLAIWFSIAAEDTIGKIFGIFFPVMAFFALGFEHSVANMYFIPIGILLKEKSAIVTAAGSPDLGNLTWEHFIVDNLIPVTLGNIVGGAIFVGFLYWFVYRRPAISAVD
jgi:formate/nitrite transporter